MDNNRDPLSRAEIEARVPKEILDLTLFDWVPVEKMFIAKYGRALSQRKIDALRKNWDPRAIGVLMLSFRPNDTYAVIDGQHRMAAAQLEGITALPARIYLDLSYEDEAVLYRRFATVNQQSAMDIFRARVEAKDAQALAILAILHKHRMDVALVPGPNRLTAIAAVERIVNQYGLLFFDEVLGLLRESWGNSSHAWSAVMLSGTAMFWYRYRSTVDRKRLVSKLQGTTPESVIAMGTQLASLLGREYSDSKTGVALRHIYNEGMRRNALAEWQPKIITEGGLASFQEGRARTAQSHAQIRRDAILAFLATVPEADAAMITDELHSGHSTVRAALMELFNDGHILRRAISGANGSLKYLYRLLPQRGDATRGGES